MTNICFWAETSYGWHRCGQLVAGQGWAGCVSQDRGARHRDSVAQRQSGLTCPAQADQISDLCAVTWSEHQELQCSHQVILFYGRLRDGLQIPVQPRRHRQRQPPRQQPGAGRCGVPHIFEELTQVSISIAACEIVNQP